jgi:peptidyl-prolyl cis-trans isomerase D
MFDWVAKHRRWIQFALLLVIVPSFAMVGVNYYFKEYGDASSVAKVAGTKISPREFELALRERQEQIRQQSQGKADPALLDSPEVRLAVINGLVDKRALLAHAMGSGLAVTDDTVRKVVTGIAAFRDESTNQFSPARYEQILKRENLTPPMFEERVRQDLRLSLVRDTVVAASMLSDTSMARLATIRDQQREVSAWIFSADQYAAGVSVGDDEIAKFYAAHQSDFKVPERARIEYVKLSLDDVTATAKVPEDELRKAWESQSAKYTTPEERRASHILIAVAKDAKPAEKAAAKAKAQALLATLTAAPKRFAEVAKAESQDPGSARNGGDLGSFGRGTMAKPFEDAVFGAKVGDLVGPVETEYGFHVIRVDAIRVGETVPFEKARAEIEQELRRSRAGRAFAEAAEQLQELVNNPPDSLEPAAKALNLTVQKSDWITRNGGGDPLLAKPALLEKVFADDAVKQKLNTLPVEVAPNTLVAARIADWRAQSFLPLEDVRNDVKLKLIRDKAAAAAEAAGRAQLAKLQMGEAVVGAKWGPAGLVSLQKPGAVPAEAARAVFGAGADGKLPDHVGLVLKDTRFAIYRVSRIEAPPTIDADTRKALRAQIAQLATQQQFDAYLQAVKAGAGVSVDAAKIEKRPPQ